MVKAPRWKSQGEKQLSSQQLGKLELKDTCRFGVHKPWGLLHICQPGIGSVGSPCRGQVMSLGTSMMGMALRVLILLALGSWLTGQEHFVSEQGLH